MADNTLSFVISSKNDGYPSFNELPDLYNLDTQAIPCPKLIFDTACDDDFNSGYPAFKRFGDLTNMKTQVAPFPKLMLNVDPQYNSGYPCLYNIGDLASMKTQEAPYPKLMLVSVPEYNSGYPCLYDFGDLVEMKTQIEPYPKLMLVSVDNIYDGYPSHNEEVPSFGAFSNIPTLEKVTIPESVKHIADYAFYNTSIKEVTIASDCEFYSHTFPEDCVVKYY